MVPESRSSSLSNSSGAGRSSSGLLRVIRRPLMAYLVIMTIVSAAFGVNQSYVNRHLRLNDYRACLRAQKLSAQANNRLMKLKQEPLHFTENCAKLKP